MAHDHGNPNTADPKARKQAAQPSRADRLSSALKANIARRKQAAVVDAPADPFQPADLFQPKEEAPAKATGED